MFDREFLIFVDLDGPILDNSRRLYALYRECLSMTGTGRAYTLREYWDSKRSRVHEKTILKKSGVTGMMLKKCADHRLRLIESKKYLAYNRMARGARRALRRLGSKGALVLVTNRMSRPNLLWELRRFHIRAHFRAVLSAPLTRDGWKTKARLIRSFLGKKKRFRGVIIGDTEVDIRAGRITGLTTIAVENGIRDRENIERHRPDFIVPSLAEAAEVAVTL